MFGTEITELLLSISCYFVVSVDDEDMLYYSILKFLIASFQASSIIGLQLRINGIIRHRNFRHFNACMRKMIFAKLKRRCFVSQMIF